jgi:hypothetical protein
MRRRFLPALTAIACLLAFSPAVVIPASAGADPVVTLTKHVQLGFNLNAPISTHPSGCLASVLGGCIFNYDLAFTGTADVFAEIPADITLSYNSADLVPGGSVPVHFTYTPTSGGSVVSANISGTAVVSFTGCTNCPATLPLTLASGSATFTAPMDSDPPVTIPTTSSTVTLSAPIIGAILSANLAGSLGLAPAPPGLLPGLGGAAAVEQVAGASLTSSPFLEWDTAGQTINGTIQLPVTPNGVDISLQPVLHWLGTSGSVSVDLHWSTAVKVLFDILAAPLCFCTLSDPAPISLFSGGLGPVYTSIGLDTMIGNAVGPPAGSLVAARVAAGFIPVPLLQPPLATIPPIPSTLGSTTFSIPGVSISGAPTAAILTGTPVALTANVNRGTAPFSFSWTRNGAPFATSQTVTDTPPLGSTTYAVTVTDAAGAISNTDSATVDVYDFTVAVTPSDQTVLRGGSVTYNVATAFVPGSAGTATATLSTSGLPADAITNFVPPTLPIGNSASLTVQAGAVSLGDFPFQAIGTTTGARSGSANLHIFDYVVALSPSSETVPAGAPATYALSTMLAAGSSLTGVPTSIATSISGLPVGATTSGFPASLPLGTTSSSATFIVNTATSTPTGSYTLTATGSTGFGSRSGTTLLVVITVQQATQNLINTIDGMGLSNGLETSLGATLKQLIDQINAGKITPACNKLDAFMMKVNVDLMSGKLTAAQAMLLLVQAVLIEDSLGC